MNKKVFTLALAILAIFSTNRLSANDIIDVNGGNVIIMGIPMNIPDYEKWHYFSFAEGKVIGTSNFELTNMEGALGNEVPNAEWAARSDWDIAFHATDIRTNGAKAVLIADTTSTTPLTEVYAALTKAPVDGYEADEMVNGTFIQTMTPPAPLPPMPPVRATKMSICKATNGWATFGMSSNKTNPMVVVFKLTGGRYVKVFLKDFFDADQKPGYINMEYAEINTPTKIIDIVTDIKFNIYPNPATDILNIELNEVENNSSIAIYSMAGACVKQVSAKAGINTISISNLPSGTYFVRASDTVQKLIVK